jgi:hypothetical protein
MALSLIGVAASLTEIFVVCMLPLRIIISLFNIIYFRCFPSDLSTTTGLAIVYLSFMWRGLELGVRIHVGNGIGVNTVE